MNSTIISEPLYLAPISVYKNYVNAQHILFDTSKLYQKKTLKNRTYILGANGILRLSIPIIHENNEKQQFKNIKISYAEKWQKDHWNSIISAYRRSPFFEYYEDEIKIFYNNKYEFLYEFNLELHQWLVQKIGITLSSELKDTNKVIHYDNIDMVCKTYLQVFSDRFPFQNNLSIIDLLFNLGGKSTKMYLERK